MQEESEIPPRPKRVDFETSRAYHRAYEGWRYRYDPKRRAAVNARSKARYTEKQVERLEAKRLDYANRTDEHKARQARWRAENRDKLRASHAEYEVERRRRLGGALRNPRAAPPWLTEGQWREIAGFYAEAQRLTETTGIYHSVDHIWPIKGAKSCGLHVPWNLRVMTHRENVQKASREPDE
jgi:hypothetical protein